jgi:hypothetical protein
LRVGPGGRVLVLLDADDDCPANLARFLLERARGHTDLDVSVVLAKREFEAWFLAAAESLRGRRGLSHDLSAPGHPEDVRGAKEWLSHRRTDGHAYSAPIDQPALASAMDLELARRAPSFDKCYREICRLLRAQQRG